MDIKDVLEAKERLKGVIRETGLIRTDISDAYNLYLKPENLQVTGSFKVRGAFNKMLSLTEEEKKRGVIACSAGNHAQGVALAAMRMGIRAVICMPESAPNVKVEATRAMGAEVILVPGVYDDAYDRAIELAKRYGFVFIHPFNDEKVIAGQGTIALEILEELPETDAILCAVGGGGLISGVAMAAKSIKPSVKVFGVESAGAASMFISVAKGYIDRLETVSTIADGIAVKEPGKITFDYVSRYVDDLYTVRDEDIVRAIRKMLSREKIVAEGAGAAPVAAALIDILPESVRGKNIVTVVSGGNIDIEKLLTLMESGPGEEKKKTR